MSVDGKKNDALYERISINVGFKINGTQMFLRRGDTGGGAGLDHVNKVEKRLGGGVM